MSSRILVPLDGSELAECALPWAEYLAQLEGCSLELIRCFEPPDKIFLVTDFLKSDSDTDPTDVIRTNLQAYLEEKREEITSVETEAICLEGSAPALILKQSEKEGVKAVVMASHGRGGLGRWLLGSVATKVARGSSKTPVLVVKAEAKREAPKLGKILVPLDGSKTAEAALPKAVALAKKSGAAIHLYRGITFAPLGHPQLDAAVNVEAAKAQEYLDQFKKKYSDVTMTAEAQITGLSSGITAQAGDCDLIVMSSHGRSGVKRWLLGSIAENIIQSTEKPVMIVHPGKD